MRELKFRAWDKTRNIYGEVLALEYKASDKDERFCGHNGRLSLCNLKNEKDCGFWGIWIEKAELEQYIGLKDKNGKEIYDGDILGGACGLVVHWCDVCHGWQLTYPGEGCYSCSGDVMFNEYVSDDLEVIGNIHENPDLLT